MTQSLKIECLVTDLTLEGEVASFLVTKEQLTAGLSKKADLVDGKIKESNLPDFIANGFQTVNQKLSTLETSITDGIQSAKDYAEAYTDEKLIQKADLVDGKVPVSQLPTISEYSGLSEALTGVLDQARRDMIERTDEIQRTKADIGEDGKVLREQLPNYVKIPGLETVIKDILDNKVNASDVYKKSETMNVEEIEATVERISPTRDEVEKSLTLSEVVQVHGFEQKYIDAGGYPYGAVLTLVDGVTEVVSVINNNKNNPNENVIGWKPHGVGKFITGMSYGLNAEVILSNGDKVKSTVVNNTSNPNVDMAGWVYGSGYNDKNQFSINEVLTNGYAYVEWFGDTINDATNAINMCLLYCRNYNKTAKGTPNKKYKISNTVLIQSSCDFTKSKFEAPLSLAKPAIQITNRGTGLTHIRAKSIKLPELTNNRELGVVPTVGSIGVQILGGMRNCDITFDNIHGFEENLQLKSDTLNNDEFIAYNKFMFNGLLAGSKVNIHLWIVNTGWVNQCTWIGGQFAGYSQDRAVFESRNLKISKTTATGNNPPNGHTFVGCSMEGNFTQTIEYDLHPDITTSYYSLNTFVNCRFESSVSMKFSPYALYDTFVGCYGLYETTYVNDVRPTIIGSARTGHLFFDVAAIVGDTGSRTAKNTFMFAAGNSSSAIPLSVGFNKIITGGLQSSGSYVMFHPTNAALLQPLVRIALDGGSPSILMGDGVTTPTEKIFRYAPSDWRHTFNLRPNVDIAQNLGSATLRYKEVHVQDLAIYPPAINIPTTNGEVTFELTSNTQLKIYAKGSDGVVRSATLTLT